MAGKVYTRVGELARRKGIKFASELQRRMEVNYITANRLFNDEGEAISYEILATLCKVLDCQPGDILHYDPEVPTEKKTGGE